MYDIDINTICQALINPPRAGVVNNGIEHHFLRHLMPLNRGNPAPSLVDDVTINGCTSNKPHREGNFPVVIILHLIFFHFRVN